MTHMTIGPVSMFLYAETPVFLSLDVSLSSEATVSASVYASANMKAGFRYSVSSSPSLQQISNNVFTYDGTGLTFDSLCGGEAAVQFAITPVAQLVVSFIGGPVGIGLLSDLLHFFRLFPLNE